MSVRKLVYISILSALAIGLGLLESWIPTVIPGVKLGLANLVILIAMMSIGFWGAFAIDMAKVLIVSLLSGTFGQMGFVMSLVGSLLSFFAMYLITRFKNTFSPVGASAAGGYLHILGQMFVAVIYLGTWDIFYYFPIASLLSLASGILMGILALLILRNGYFQRNVQRYLSE